MNNKKELIKLYTDFVTNRDLFAIEAEYISYQIKHNLLNNVVDIGCNCGHLAKSILDITEQINQYTGIDAVKLYLEVADSLVNNPKFKSLGAFLIPPKIITDRYPNEKIINTIYRKVKFFNVDPTAMLGTSSLHSLHDEKRVLLELCAPYEIDDFVDSNLKMFNQTTYCKIDIDGNDCELVAAIVNKTDTQCIQFEVCPTAYVKYIKLGIFELLYNAGFLLPEQDFLSEFDFNKDTFILSVSKTNWWYAIAERSNATSTTFNCKFVSSWGKTNLQFIDVSSG